MLPSLSSLSGRLRRLALALLAVVLLCPSAAAMTTLMGGRTFGALDGRHAARAEMGWPGLKLTWLLPVAEAIDVSPQFGMIYGHNMRTGLVGYEPGVEIRWTLWDKQRWSVAFRSDPALLLWVPTDGSDGQIALRGGPGIVAGYQVGRDVSVFGGVEMPLRLAMTPSLSFAAPILLQAGGEVQVFRDEQVTVNALAHLSLGPELCAGDCRGAEVSARMSLGAVAIW